MSVATVLLLSMAITTPGSFSWVAESVTTPFKIVWALTKAEASMKNDNPDKRAADLIVVDLSINKEGLVDTK
jgi:hypothetical protein